MTTAPDNIETFCIRGITHQGKTFRPGDWGERLMGVITLYVGERQPGLHVASTRLAMPVVEAGVKCLIVCGELRRVCPDAFDFVMRFARDNALPVEVRVRPRDEAPQSALAQITFGAV
ncbi:DUF3579 domain-containing protein [Trinickia violacea]|uniref:DUF3579 domain-containing protein n=1 Tax=Trinickia violacea TaxID=2571746 RepID=A0A4P8IIK2_9BURK|nr:DUF3579 domain-containing protein [Trinickia violacea]QCP48538.1 DUF3579 domain-containing protein [Trinickia violacea]